jgi:hypothetical protein
MAYLTVEKPRFLFLQGHDRRRHHRASRCLRGACRYLRGSHRLFRRLPGGGRSHALPRCLFLRGSRRRGRRLPPFIRGLPPTTFLLLFFLRRRVLQHHRGRKSLLLAQPELFISLLPALPAPDPPLLLQRRPLLFLPLRHAHTRSGSGRGRVGPCSVHGHPLLGRAKRRSRGGTWRKNKGKGEEFTHRRAIGKHDERPEVVIAVLDSLEVNGAPRPHGRVLLGETVV